MKTTAIYVVAGMSSRFNGKIKQLEKVGPNGETLLGISMKQAIRAGFSEIILVVGQKTQSSFKEAYGDEFDGVPIKYTIQTYNSEKRDRPWGTTDALVTTLNLVDNPFMIANGDDLYGVESFKQVKEVLVNGDNVAIGYRLFDVLPDEGQVTRGTFVVENGFVIQAQENYHVAKDNLTEKGLSKDDNANMNLFGLQPKTLKLLSDNLEKFKKENASERKKESVIVEDLGNLIKSNQMTMRCETAKGYWIGITNPGDEKIVQEFLQNNPNLL